MTAYWTIIRVFECIAAGIGVVVLFRNVRADFWFRIVIGGTLAIFLLHLYAALHYELFGYDFRIFCNAGRDVWRGLDPFSEARSSENALLVNPPTSLPLFALFATLPFRVSLAVWTILNLAASLALPAMAWFALRAQDRIDQPARNSERMPSELPFQMAAGLAVCLVFSEASVKGFLLGQLSVFTAVMLLLALWSQGASRPIAAGVCLFLATVKVGTMLPFLLLFFRRADRWTWAVLTALVIGSCLMTGNPRELPARLVNLTNRIAKLSQPGNVNDYSYAGTRNESIIGFEPLFYRLGLRDRVIIRHAQSLALLTLGGAIAWLVVPGRVRRTDAVCLISFFSMLFVYHRDYDCILLTLPMVHSALRLRAIDGRPRWLYAACGLIVIAVLYIDPKHLKSLREVSLDWGAWGSLVQAVILPCMTWLILLAMALLTTASRRQATVTIDP
jgi:hypothetical protein